MKKVSLLICILAIIVSCTKKTTDRNRALQCVIDGAFFGSVNPIANENEDGSYTIRGVNGNEIITINLDSAGEGPYQLGSGTPNSATYSINNELIYSTDPFGSGSVFITDWDTNNLMISGNFSFGAVIPGLDTINVNQGLLFKIPYTPFTTIDVIPDVEEQEDVQNNAGTFVAKIDGEDFNPISVTAIRRTTGVEISGINNEGVVSIQVPTNVTPGSYQISDNGFSGTYTVGEVTEEATKGSIIVTTHDTNTMIIQGTFSLTTENFEITNGQFSVLYQDL